MHREKRYVLACTSTHQDILERSVYSDGTPEPALLARDGKERAPGNFCCQNCAACTTSKDGEMIFECGNKSRAAPGAVVLGRHLVPKEVHCASTGKGADDTFGPTDRMQHWTSDKLKNLKITTNFTDFHHNSAVLM